jgi:hypothetical protein
VNPRLIILCAALAFTAITPAIADAIGLDFPLWLRFALLPLSEALHYTAVVIHEPGHALTHWLFGEPALPTLDLEHGGGMTYAPGRSYALTAFIYALAAAGIFLLLRAHKKRVAIRLAVAVPVHAALILSGLDRFVSLIAGHGAEIAAGAVLSALPFARPDWLKRPIERCIALTAGLYLLERNLFMCLNLLLNAARRREYAMQKGIPGLGDYQHACDVIGVSVQAVAAGMGVATVAAALAALLYIRISRGSSA